MSNKQPNSIIPVTMTIVAICGACTLLFLPDLLSGMANILAWVVIALISVIAGVLFYFQKQQQKLIQEQEFERRRRNRKEQRKKEQAEQEKRLQKMQAVTARKEVVHEEKQNEIKAQIAKKAKVVWGKREEEAKQQELQARQVIANTQDMSIRQVAGYVATEWNEASMLAQWTAQQLIMFSQRPNVTTQAREEEREAIMKAEEIKASGNTLTSQQGNDLKNKKKKARDEIKIEEIRLKEVQDIIDNAEIKWRGFEMRINRQQHELDVLLKKSKRI